MIRIKLTSLNKEQIVFASRDLIHDAAINMLIKAGAKKDSLIGRTAAVWSASAMFVKKSEVRGFYQTNEVVISTTDPEITKILLSSKLSNFKASKSNPDEAINLSDWVAEVEECPVINDADTLNVVCASPVVISKRNSDRKRWVLSPDDTNITDAVNARLSKLSGRNVDISIKPDTSYLSRRANPSVKTVFKAGERPSIVHGMMFPMTLNGSAEDLELAWYCGLGEKTRLGYGTICSARRVG